jgi:hypothetical protein
MALLEFFQELTHVTLNEILRCAGFANKAGYDGFKALSSLQGLPDVRSGSVQGRNSSQRRIENNCSIVIYYGSKLNWGDWHSALRSCKLYGVTCGEAELYLKSDRLQRQTAHSAKFTPAAIQDT